MPNWVYNQLTVEGEADIVADFIKTAKGKNGDIDFNSFIPMPKELLETEQVYYADPEKKAKQEAIYAANKAKHGFESWYDWACEKWNTKWNAGEVQIVHEDKSGISYDFQTAWDAPLPVIVEMSKKFPELKFTLQSDEESQEFYYEKEFIAGEQIWHKDLEREEE